MSDQDSEPSASYMHQIGQLTKSVSEHEKTLEGLKEVPEMLKNILRSIHPSDEQDETAGDASFDFMNSEEGRSGDQQMESDDGLEMAKMMGFDDTETGTHLFEIILYHLSK